MPFNRTVPSGRTGHISVSYKDFILVWGGYKENEADHINSYFSPKELLVYCAATETWRDKNCSIDDGPPGMSGSTAAIIGDYMYVFGGYCHDPEGSTNQLYRLNLEEFAWEHLRPKEHAPFAVDKTVSWHAHGKLYTFGGYGSPTSINAMNCGFEFVFDHVLWRGWTNQFYEYDPEENAWNVPQFKGDLPVPRAAHAVAVLGHRAYIFGGRHNRRRMNDLHYCDMNSLEWSGEIEVKGQRPQGRSWHSLTPVSDRLILLYGGFSHSGEALSDCWFFDAAALIWQRLELGFQRPRLWHSACFTSYGDVMIFGGCSSNILDADRRADQANDIILIRISPKSLFRICLDRVGELPELYPYWCSLPHSVQAILNLRHCSGKATSLDGS